jgi:hypothetical protein
MAASDSRGSTGRYPSGEQLLAEAEEATGLSDFGPGDFREGLEVLLESLAHDADLHPDTDAAVVGTLRRRLVNRLLVEQWLADHPGILDLEVRGPIDIIGLPRTGTTALGNMLSRDPQLRPLRNWEQANPVPPPRLADEATDPRRLQAIADDEAVPPLLKAMHIWDADSGMEDSDVLGMAFHGQQYTLPVYGYHAWWRRADSTDAFGYHRRISQLLQSERPPNLWLSKAPHHKFHLEAIAAAYPEAKFVMTHRDPARSVPSYASFVSHIFPAANRERDLHRVGREVCDHLREGMERCIAARARLGEERFCDVHHRELVADPMGTLQRVYDFAGLTITPEFEQALVRWQERNGPGAHGHHRYTPEEFGLTAAGVRADYDFYIRHFDVEIEG